MNTNRTTTFRAAKAITLTAGLLSAFLASPALASGGSSSGGSGSSGGSSSSGKSDIRMVSTGVDTDAFGRAKLKVRTAADGRFELRVGNLDPGATYDIIFSGVSVGKMTTDTEGQARARFRSQPRSSSDTLLGFDPRGLVVVIRDAAGRDVLAGDVPTGASNTSDDSKIVCCVPDDRGTECEDRTAQECTDRSGTVSTATTCLPNPCDTAVVPTEDNVVCCTPDDSGPECEDRTVAECSAHGGIVVQANSCLDTPCAAVPSIDAYTRCCTADDSGNECEARLPSECLARGGVDIGAGVCAVDSCDGIPVPTGTETIKIDCEKRSDRSRVSVNGKGLRAGAYTANITSGANSAAAAAQAAVLGEAEFDFDSDGGDIGAGATAISASFLSGSSPTVTAQILDENGNMVAEGTTACRVK